MSTPPVEKSTHTTEHLAVCTVAGRFERPTSKAASSRGSFGLGSTIRTIDALDEAFAGAECEFVRADGTSQVMPVHRWAKDADFEDLELFVDAVNAGPVLDVGCGPGRLTDALRGRGVEALGIDISPQAVRQARGRGAAARCQDIFDPLPGLGAWRHMLLAVGNIGLGGDPVRLLRRVAELLDRDGSVLVELAGPGVGTVHEQVRLRVGSRTSEAFSWATVGLDGVEDVASAAGMSLVDIRCVADRYVARLHHDRPIQALALEEVDR